jgi:hypothetical protein
VDHITPAINTTPTDNFLTPPPTLKGTRPRPPPACLCPVEYAL